MVGGNTSAQGTLWSVWVGKCFTWMPDQTLLYSPKQLVVNDLPPAPNLLLKGKVKFGDWSNHGHEHLGSLLHLEKVEKAGHIL